MGLEEQRGGCGHCFQGLLRSKVDKDFKKKILDDPQIFLVEFQDGSADFSEKKKSDEKLNLWMKGHIK